MSTPKKEVVEQEIRNHAKWCGKDCQTFIASVYREKRLKGRPAKSLQNDYDSCHATR